MAKESNSITTASHSQGSLQKNTFVAPAAKRSKTGTRLTTDFINHIREMIEFVMGQYMGKDEAVDYLYDQAAIDPNCTRAVWTKLEENNKDLFKAYYKRVLLKKQAAIFVRQVEEHLHVMKAIELVQSESQQIENNLLAGDENCSSPSLTMAMGDVPTQERTNGSSSQSELPSMEDNPSVYGLDPSEDIYFCQDGLNAEEIAELQFTFPELSNWNLSTIFPEDDDKMRDGAAMVANEEKGKMKLTLLDLHLS